MAVRVVTIPGDCPSSELGWRAGRADDRLENLTEIYSASGKPVPVSFRALLPELNTPDRATHLMHPYPAKLLRHIPYFFLACQRLAPAGSVVLDPFCGSGTVLVETVLAQRVAAGADANPLARLIATVKTQPLDTDKVRSLAYHLSIPRTGRYTPTKGGLNLKYWYSRRHLNELSNLLEAIGAIEDDGIRSFFQVAFSASARQLSLADPRVSVPVRLRPDRYPETHWLRSAAERRLAWLKSVSAFEYFYEACNANASRLDALLTEAPWASSVELRCDARSVGEVERPQADLVITSPPYLGAQKYLRSSSLSLTWLGFAKERTIRDLEATVIGREHASRRDYGEPPTNTRDDQANALILDIRRRNPLRAHLASTYLIEMRDALLAIEKALRPGGHLVLVAGANQVAGFAFPTHHFLSEILSSIGMKLELELIDEIRSRGLMTKRNRTASVIESERVLLFRKP